MIHFEEFTHENGLHVVVHQDKKSPIVCLNLLYKVGSRNEKENKTGFAHLFEHLMFGGSLNAPSFDEPLQAVGGDNNAFTNADITNYYTLVPANNVETAFWLESDRMKSLNFDQKSLDVQKGVVIEEFKQRYLNRPYGDVWLKLRPEAYKVHPYRWPTIGKDISHIEDAQLSDVKDFFGRHYVPSNAILVVAGNISVEDSRRYCEKWFGDIHTQDPPKDQISKEPVQRAHRIVKVEEDVPQNAFYKVYHMGGRNDSNYHSADLLTDILGQGRTSKLFQRMVDKSRSLTSVSSYVTGNIDPGLLVIEGKLNDDISFEQIESELGEVISKLQDSVKPDDVKRMQTLVESSFAFGNVELLNRAMGLAYSAFLGNPDLLNQELALMKRVRTEDIIEQSQEILRAENCTTLYYQKA